MAWGPVNVSSGGGADAYTLIAVPAQAGMLTYSGEAQSPVWNNYDEEKLEIGGEFSATDAGNYTATFTPKDPYHWADGSISTVSVTWIIWKAAGSVSLSSTSVSIEYPEPNAEVSVSRYGDGEISAKSADTDIATVKVDGTTIKVTATGSGTTTVTVSVGEGTNYTEPISATFKVEVSWISSVLDEVDWPVISEVAGEGQAENYWAIGDRKAVELNGTVGRITFSDDVYYCYIVGFGHNSALEGTNLIHFQFGYDKQTEGTHIAFTDNQYSTYGGTAELPAFIFTEGDEGWSESYARTTICPQFKSAMPAGLRNLIKNVTKYTNNKGPNVESSVTATVEEIFIMSYREMTDNIGAGDYCEFDYQEEYAYYKAGNLSDFHGSFSPGLTCYTLSRTRMCSEEGFSNQILTRNIEEQSGAMLGTNASWGFAPCFCI